MFAAPTLSTRTSPSEPRAPTLTSNPARRRVFRPPTTAKRLAEATPRNGCLYVLPRWADPGYSAPGGSEASKAPLASLSQLQHVRALPVPAGGLIMFTHRLLHWGGEAHDATAPPRIALSNAMAMAQGGGSTVGGGGGPLLVEEALVGLRATCVGRCGLAAAQCLMYAQNLLDESGGGGGMADDLETTAALAAEAIDAGLFG